ncbi:MAG: hypothetical protein SGJ20_18550 [Planctomycetota bacterium]|nr:hypothetical protein [Planctomycetota bacterium]
MFRPKIYPSVALLAVVLLLATSMVRPLATEEAAKIVPDPEIQKKIQAVSEAMLYAGDEGGELKAFQAIQQLQKLGPNYEKLAKQLILYHSNAKGMVEGMTMSMVVQFVEISDTTLVQAVLPWIDQDRDRLDSAANEILNIVEDKRGNNYDFSTYTSLIDGALRTGAKVPDVLIVRMIEQAPQQAIEELAITFSARKLDHPNPILWESHVVDHYLWKRRFGFAKANAPDPELTKALTQLAKNDNWWVRLYVAEMIVKHPELSTPELKKQLSEDKHEAVVNAVTRKERAAAKARKAQEARVKAREAAAGPSVQPAK